MFAQQTCCLLWQILLTARESLMELQQVVKEIRLNNRREPISQPELSVRVSTRRQLRQCSGHDHEVGAVRSSLPKGPRAGPAVQRAMGLAAEPTRQANQSTG